MPDPRTNALTVRHQINEVLEWALRARDDFRGHAPIRGTLAVLADDVDQLEALQEHDTPAIAAARDLYLAADTLRTMAAKAGSIERNLELGELADEVERAADNHMKGIP